MKDKCKTTVHIHEFREDRKILLYSLLSFATKINALQDLKQISMDNIGCCMWIFIDIS